ncbi:hypothetical protein IFHNHDMJ_02585 [Synechococcus sp. CBW1107]|nr:hypothetical protein IFHNHDMJ_02585 [Synechococcus sp. CBW1107]
MSLRLSGGRTLLSPPGHGARPTPARVREAVMNMLCRDLPDATWLDLFSGSGAMGCEALQRGAAVVVAVDKDRRHAAISRSNLEAVAGVTAATRWTPERTTVSDPCLTESPLTSPSLTVPKLTVICQEVIGWLKREQAGTGFDLIYADPPYQAGLYPAIAAALLDGTWLAPGGTLIWECASNARPELPAGWRCRDERRYGSTTIQLLEVNRPVSAAEGTAAAVLVPGSHEQPHQGHGDQTQHDAAEQGFDHGETP